MHPGPVVEIGADTPSARSAVSPRRPGTTNGRRSWLVAVSAPIPATGPALSARPAGSVAAPTTAS